MGTEAAVGAGDEGDALIQRELHDVIGSR
jgi:hypothetical protein